MNRWTIATIIAFASFPAAAQIPLPPTDKVLVVTGYDLVATGAQSSSPLVGNERMIRASAETWFLAPVRLPDGAIVTGIELQSCNASPDTFINVRFLNECFPPGGVCPQYDLQGVGSVTPGVCKTQRHVYTGSPIGPIDNRANTYWLSGFLGSYPDDKIAAIRLYYRTSVTPEFYPAVFSDVPTDHPFYKFIQALYAAGLTAGCGNGKYCPDAPLTRGQFAVLLAHALGVYTFQQ